MHKGSEALTRCQEVELSASSKAITIRWLSFALLYAAFCVLGPYDVTSSVSLQTLAPPDISQAQQAVERGSLLRRAGFLALGAASALTLMRHGRRRFSCNGPLAFVLAAFLLLALASPLWAGEPGLAARRVGVLVMLSLTALAAAGFWSTEEVLNFATASTIVTLTVGLIAELAFGTFRPADGAYRFGGVMHPNNMGAEMAVLLVATTCRVRTLKRMRVAWSMLAAIALLFLFLTGSRGALLGAVTAALICLVLPHRRAAFGLLACSVALFSVVAISLLIASAGGAELPSLRQLLSASAERDPGTLTGRTELWSELLPYWAERPLLGFGYNAFWSPRHISEVAAGQGWVVGSSHSGYIDSLVNLGVVGFGLFAAASVLGLLSSTLAWWRKPRASTLFFVGLLMWLLLQTTVEVILFETNVPSFVAMVALAQLAFVSASTETQAVARGPAGNARLRPRSGAGFETACFRQVSPVPVLEQERATRETTEWAPGAQHAPGGRR